MIQERVKAGMARAFRRAEAVSRPHMLADDTSVAVTEVPMEWPLLHSMSQCVAQIRNRQTRSQQRAYQRARSQQPSESRNRSLQHFRCEKCAVSLMSCVRNPGGYCVHQEHYKMALSWAGVRG
jgi:hypothetical protein